MALPASDDLRLQLSTLLIHRAATLAADAAAAFRFTAELLDEAFSLQLATSIVHLLAAAVRDGRIDVGEATLAELHQAARERALSADRLFTIVYLTERTVLDDLAVDADIGATSEHWPLTAQHIRGGAYHLLAALARRAQLEPVAPLITDPLTSVYTRALFDGVLAKSVEQAGRYGDQLSVIVIDIDNMAGINAAYGYGVGDRILERAGILIRGFFRRDDWVARHGGDSFAVLLSRTDPEAVASLARNACITLAERLDFVDHRSGTPVRVTASAAIVNVCGTVGAAIDPERLLADAEAALERAKQREGERLERLDREPSVSRAPAPNRS